MLPKDPYMLLSVVNTELRDRFPTLERFAKAHSVAVEDIVSPLEKAGFVYDSEKNSFVQN